MYEPGLKYITISYRWGEVVEQLLQTPDYVAHISSFELFDLKNLCKHIHQERDLKEIRYLWVDGISVDQQNHERKKETILQMNQIYQHASYILAVPDLHKGYLLKNPANSSFFYLDDDFIEKIHKEMQHDQHEKVKEIINDQEHNELEQSGNEYLHHSFINKNKNRIEEHEDIIENGGIQEKEEEYDDDDENKKNMYKFFAYLMEDWSKRAWVVSEYQIAKEKYIQYGTPLKYIYLTLLLEDKPFFSYHFDTDNGEEEDDDEKVFYEEVCDSKSFNQFVKGIFTQRPHMEIMLNSNATRNEDRFNAILPSWKEYNHKIKNQNTISEWGITGMTSVRLKLYELMDDNLCHKTILFNACSKYHRGDTILPTFATKYDKVSLELDEKDHNNYIFKKYRKALLDYIYFEKEEEEYDRINQLVNDYKTNAKPLWTENLISIRLVNQDCLIIKSNIYFIKELDEEIKNAILKQYPFLGKWDECIHYVYIPYYTYTIPDYNNVLPKGGSSSSLVGNLAKNKWVLYREYESDNFISEFTYSNDYSFNIY